MENTHSSEIKLRLENSVIADIAELAVRDNLPFEAALWQVVALGLSQYRRIVKACAQ